MDRRGDELARRLLQFAADVLRMTSRSPRHFAARHLARQLVRSATGGGALYEEARCAESRADFVHKIKIAAKEMRESLYWLKLMRQAQLATASMSDPALA